MIDPWHHFSTDWSECASTSDLQLGKYQQQAILAILNVQQEAATRMKAKAPNQDYRQFSSEIRSQS